MNNKSLSEKDTSVNNLLKAEADEARERIESRINKIYGHLRLMEDLLRDAHLELGQLESYIRTESSDCILGAVGRFCFKHQAPLELVGPPDLRCGDCESERDHNEFLGTSQEDKDEQC